MAAAAAYKPEQARVPPILAPPPPPVTKFKIALLQLSVTADKERNIAHARKAVEEAAGKGAELVLLPEIWNSPYSNDSFPVYAEDIEAGGDAAPSYSMLSEAARSLQITIIGGSIPERSGDCLYNTCCIFGKDGTLKGKHRKLHLFDIDIPGKITFKESKTLTAGQHPTIVDTASSNQETERTRPCHLYIIPCKKIYSKLPKRRKRYRAAEMGSDRSVVCIKKVKGGIPEEEWDETMPLPGDIIESVSTSAEAETGEDSTRAPSLSWKRKRELRAQLRRLNRQGSESVWVRVRRGDVVHNLRARIVPEKGAKIHRKFTIQAARDDRHVAVLADLTLDECSELQETSRKTVNTVNTRFEKNKGVGYDWKKKVGTYLPDRHSTVISSILFMPFSHERSVESATTRCMAWFTAAVSSGAPLVFVNIQTEQTSNSGKYASSEGVTRQLSWRELSWGRQQSPRKSTTAEMVQGIRLWFLPGVAEVPVVLTIEPDETRFGMDIRRTEEGFICISSVSNGSAADRAGLRKLCHEASQRGHLVVISRLEGSSIAPSLVSSEGLVQCCDNSEIRNRLTNAINRREDVQLYIMAWSELRCLKTPQIKCSKNLPPPTTDSMGLDENLNRKYVDPNFLKL